jgi:molybdenum cofactor synthesis domain-containing protein
VAAPPAPATGGLLSDVCGSECERPAAPAPLLPGPATALLPAPAAALAPAKAVALNVGVLTVSDRAAAGTYEDLSGPAVQAGLARFAQQAAAAAAAAAAGHGSGGGGGGGGITWRLRFVCSRVVPDDRAEIERTLTEWCEPGNAAGGGVAGAAPCNLVLTTGGTGFAPRDVTPEATAAVLEKRAPGLVAAAMLRTLATQPLAMLSRAVAGVRKGTVIVNLPGRPSAVDQHLEILAPALGVAVAQASGQV